MFTRINIFTMTNDSSFLNPFQAASTQQNKEFARPAKYKIWNPNPSNPTAPPTPGVVMDVPKLVGRDPQGKSLFEYNKEIVQSVSCVILFASHGRKLATGKGAQHRIVCQSHDGHGPSVRIAEPLCRRTTSEDVANVLAQWKGYDKAKIEGVVGELTQGCGKLQFCGIKKNTGETIPLCPFARRDAITGQSAACKPHIHVSAYDIDNKREFEMTLTGSSIANNQKFISPFYEFFKFLRNQGPIVDGKQAGEPNFAYSVTLSAIKDGAYYLLGISNYTPLDAETRSAMRERAIAARESYEKFAHWVPGAKVIQAASQQPVSVPAPQPQPSAHFQQLPEKTKADWDGDDIPF